MDGLLLALISIVTTLVKSSITLGGGMSILLVIAQLVATIWMLLYFMKRYGAEQEQYPRSMAFNYGFLTSICSNVIIMAYLLLHYHLIFPEATAEFIDSFIAGMQQAGGSNMDTIEGLAKHLPLLIPVITFFMYTIWSLIISAILASFAKKETPIFQTEEEE